MNVGPLDLSAWGVEALDNDIAVDWTYGLEVVSDLSLISETLQKAIGDQGDAQEALAACEAIARLKGSRGKTDAYTETVDTWVKNHPEIVPDPELMDTATRVIDRILDNSELKNLWESSEDFNNWAAGVWDLRARLTLH